MTKANECTCPSGDGSLAHPCPAHPAVEQAGEDERDLQGAQGERDGWGPLPIVQVPWNVFDRAVMWVEDRRRYGDDGTIVDDWKALKTIQRAALAQPSPAQAEQAEAERPIVSFEKYMQVMYDRDENAKRLDAALAEVERLRQFERICEGLPQDAIDGGWTVQGIRCYAKRLEDQLKSAQAQHSVPELDQLYSMLGAESQVDAAKKIAELVGCRLGRSALTEAQMRRLYDNSTEAENERLRFAAFARMIRRAEAVHQITAAPGKEGV